MRARISQWFDALRTGFWFVPSIMLGLAAGLALILLYVDQRFDPGIKASIAWAYSGGPEGARSLLSTIAGSMITAASVTFSLAAVALSIASQQYGSRVLRNFMRDRITQVLLGTFVSTFLYSVLIVRDIRGSDFSGGFVPAIAITVAIAMSLVSLVMLVYFVHHVSSSIQASHIVSTISKEMEESIPKLYPSDAGSPVAADSSPNRTRDQECHSIGVEKGGYLETIDVDALLKIATQSSLFLEIVSRPGDHLVQLTPVIKVWNAAPVDEKLEKKLLGTVLVGNARTPAQDIRYQFQQLTDVVVRALSPGINDPFTAINGIDALTSALILLARRPRVPKQRQDEQGNPRLLIAATGIGELLHATVGHIAVYAAADPFVMTRLRELLDMIEPDLTESSELVALHSLQNDLNRQRQAKEA
ncbi:MAG: DUF2254 domain-containing protein [Nitrospirota bacterium]|nr:DUF2254 domain-containing protein [Nitrospirota bacterium]